LDKKWSILLSGFLLSSLEGIAFTWGIIILPLVYEFGWSQAEASAPLGIFMVTSIVTLILAGYLQDKYGPAKIAAFGGLVFIAGYALTSMVVLFPSPMWVNFSYGIITGSASGITYACIIPPISKWFPKNIAFATSVALMGSGISTLIFAPLKAGYLIPTFGIFGTFIITGVLVSMITFLASWLARDTKKQTPTDFFVNQDSSHYEAASFIQSETLPTKMLKTKSFWMIWSMYLLAGTGGFIALSLLPVYGEQFLSMSATDVALSISLFSLANAFGRPLAGKLADSYGMLKVMIIGYSLQALAYILLSISGNSALFLHIASVVAGISFAISLAIFPPLITKYFGLRNLGVNYGILSTAYGLAAISPSLGFMLYNFIGSYSIILIGVGVMSSISALIGFYLQVTKKRG